MSWTWKPINWDVGPDIPDSVVALINFDENSGGTAQDSEGGADVNVVDGSWVEDSDYYNGVGYSFDNSDAYGYVDSDDVIEVGDTGSLLIELTPLDFGPAHIWNNDDPDNDNRCYFANDDGDVSIGLGDSWRIDTNIEFSMGTLEKYILRWDDGDWSLFKDSSEADDGTYSGSVSTDVGYWFFSHSQNSSPGSDTDENEFDISRFAMFDDWLTDEESERLTS